MENNNNGRGIFYGVIGVATLVVAVIGATFAYFASQTNSANNAIYTGSDAVGNLELTQVIDGLKTNLIPVDSELGRFPSEVGLTPADCMDDNDNNICSTWQFTVTNPNKQAQQVYFYFEPSVNEFTNLHYAVFKDDKTTPATSYNVLGKAPTPENKQTAARAYSTGQIVVEDTHMTKDLLDRVEWTNLAQVLPANGGSATYTIVLWIEETDVDQTLADAGKKFAAGVRIATGQVGSNGQITGGGVTGVLATNGNQG